MFMIGNLILENRLVLAPMAGVTDLAFRLIMKGEGCGLVFSEMISAIALVRNGRKTRDLLQSSTDEKPLAVQIFGCEPDIMAEAAAIVEGQGADIIDINMGCPAKKVVGRGAGAALLKDIELVKKIVTSVRKSVSIPLTVKIRSGWDHNSVNFHETGRVIRDAGADALTLHARRASQGFGGSADWSHIREIKRILDIPIIGNGDVKTPEDVVKMISETGCDAVMVGRGVLGNPWLFSRTLEFMSSGMMPPDPSQSEILDTIKNHIGLLVRFKGEGIAVKEFRKHICWYTRGLPYSADFRKTAVHINKLDDMLDECAAYFETLKSEDDEYFLKAFGVHDGQIGA